MIELPKSNAQNIDLYLIDEPTGPMRSRVPLDSVSELADSIRTVGLINPITVVPRGDRFEVVAGHRRLLALRVIGAQHASCIVRQLDVDGVTAIMATENLERADVDPVDEALLIGRAIGEDESKIPALAKSINRSVAWVRDRLDLLGYDDQLIVAIRDGRIKLGVAKFIARVTDEKWRSHFTTDAAAHGWTVLQAEYQFNLWNSGALNVADELPPPPEGSSRPEAVAARATCEKCGKIAVYPNFRSVFIHIECPSENEIPSSQEAS